jgi:hypothetical protein
MGDDGQVVDTKKKINGPMSTRKTPISEDKNVAKHPSISKYGSQVLAE